MAVQKPMVIGSSGLRELEAGETLPVTMQDAYDNTTTTSGVKTVVLQDTVPVNFKKNLPVSSYQFTHKWVDGSDTYLGGLYLNSTSGLGICFDAGQNVTTNSFVSTQTATFQCVSSRGSVASPSALLSGDATGIFQGWARRSDGDLNSGARMVTCLSEAPTPTNAGAEIYWDVVKNGTAASAVYSAMRLTNDGNLKVFSDLLVRSVYKCPFILYALPAPYNHTGTATETKISSDISVPANMLGVNSKLKTDILTSCTTTANGKYVVVRFGPNANNTDPIMLYFNFGGVLSQHIFDTLTCRNSNTDKIGFLSYTSSSIGTSSTSKSIAMQAISVNNAVQNYITVWLKNGQTSDDSTLQMLTIEVIP